MSELEVKLTPKEIYEKDFNCVAAGYSPEEVDTLLDEITSDYRNYNHFIKELIKQNQELIDENNDLKNQERRLKVENAAINEMTETGHLSVNNVDMLRRISNLEKVVYGNKE